VLRAECSAACCVGGAGETDLKAKQEEKRLRKNASLAARAAPKPDAFAAAHAAQARARARVRVAAPRLRSATLPADTAWRMPTLLRARRPRRR
jgi:hypothetical protein